MKDTFLDLSNARTKATLVSMVQRLEGPHRVSIVKWKPRRTDRANRFYWPAIVHPFGEFLREHGNDYTDEEAHQMLKWRFLRKTWVDEATGEQVEFVPSSAKLDTEQFGTYLEQCSAWLAELGVFVTAPPANAGAAA
jgi:hypothetical protein